MPSILEQLVKEAEAAEQRDRDLWRAVRQMREWMTELERALAKGGSPDAG